MRNTPGGAGPDGTLETGTKAPKTTSSPAKTGLLAATVLSTAMAATGCNGCGKDEPAPAPSITKEDSKTNVQLSDEQFKALLNAAKTTPAAPGQSAQPAAPAAPAQPAGPQLGDKRFDSPTTVTAACAALFPEGPKGQLLPTVEVESDDERYLYLPCGNDKVDGKDQIILAWQGDADDCNGRSKRVKGSEWVSAVKCENDGPNFNYAAALKTEARKVAISLDDENEYTGKMTEQWMTHRSLNGYGISGAVPFWTDANDATVRMFHSAVAIQPESTPEPKKVEPKKVQPRNLNTPNLDSRYFTRAEGQAVQREVTALREDVDGVIRISSDNSKLIADLLLGAEEKPSPQQSREAVRNDILED